MAKEDIELRSKNTGSGKGQSEQMPDKRKKACLCPWCKVSKKCKLIISAQMWTDINFAHKRNIERLPRNIIRKCKWFYPRYY